MIIKPYPLNISRIWFDFFAFLGKYGYVYGYFSITRLGKFGYKYGYGKQR